MGPFDVLVGVGWESVSLLRLLSVFVFLVYSALACAIRISIGVNEGSGPLSEAVRLVTFLIP